MEEDNVIFDLFQEMVTKMVQNDNDSSGGTKMILSRNPRYAAYMEACQKNIGDKRNGKENSKR